MNASWLSKCHPASGLCYLALGVLYLLTKLPYRVQLMIGRGLGGIIYLCSTKLRHIAETNIRLCFPELSRQQQRAFIKKNFASLGMGIMETAMAWFLPERRLHALITAHGVAEAMQATAKNRGLILLAPHFTSIEIIGRLMSSRYDFGVMYRPHKKIWLAEILNRFRKKHYAYYIPSHRMRALVRALNDHAVIWYAYDIDAGKKHHVFAPFFGIAASSSTAICRLVTLTGAGVALIAYHRRADGGGYEVTVEPPLENFPSGDVLHDVTRLNQLLEQAIRRYPEQYLWQYKRFKTRPAGEKRFY